MTCLWIGSVGATYPLLDVKWHQSRPAHCYYRYFPQYINYMDPLNHIDLHGVACVLIVTYGYALRIGKLYYKPKADPSKRTGRKVLNWFSRLVVETAEIVLARENIIRPGKKFWDMAVIQPLVATGIVAQTLYSAYTSVTSEVCQKKKKKKREKNPTQICPVYFFMSYEY